MHSYRHSAPLSVAVAVGLCLAVATASTAQSPDGGPSCAVVTTEEVNAIFTGANLTLNDNSARWYCSFGGAFDLTISVMTETELGDGTAGFGEGEDVTVAGGPAWFQESSGNLAVPANGSVVFMNGWGSADTGDEMLALMSALAELAAPRIPPRADPAVASALSALLPPSVASDTIAVIPGWYLVLPEDASTPEHQALRDLLASQGRTTADLVFVVGSDGAGGTAIVAAVPGLDPSSLLMLLLNAVDPRAATVPVSVVEIGGQQVTRVETEPPTFAFVRGDGVVYANGSDAFVQSLLAPVS